MTDPVPVAVVGAGNMGSNHIRVYDELPGADLVEVVEPDPDRAANISDQYNVSVYGHIGELTLAEAATIAAPNEYHRPIAEALLEREFDLLVEKPLATSVGDAQAIVTAAEQAGSILQVGHIERFNPAVEMLSKILDEREIIAIETHRLGPFNEQLSETNVVFDLMIHDLDVLDNLVGTEPSHIDAVGRRSHSNEIDHAIANLRYTNSVLATVVSSHITHGKIRELVVTTRDAYIKLDYQQQSITIQKKGVDHLTSFDGESGYRTEAVTETPLIQTREPLKNELEHFLRCIRTRQTPRVGGNAGVAVIRRIKSIVEQIDEHS